MLHINEIHCIGMKRKSDTRSSAIKSNITKLLLDSSYGNEDGRRLNVITSNIYYTCSEVFTAIVYNKVYSGGQPHQCGI